MNIEDTAPIAVCPVVDNPRCDQPIIELDVKDLVGDESRINADDDAKVSALPKGTSSVENILDGSLCEILPHSPIDSSCNTVQDLGANPPDSSLVIGCLGEERANGMQDKTVV